MYSFHILQFKRLKESPKKYNLPISYIYFYFIYFAASTIIFLPLVIPVKLLKKAEDKTSFVVLIMIVYPRLLIKNNFLKGGRKILK